MDALRSYLLDRHPGINLHRGRVEKALGHLKIEHYGALEGSFDLGGYLAQEDTASKEEYGITLEIQVDLPLRWRDANDAAKAAQHAGLKKAQYELKKITAEVLGNAEESFNRLQIDEEQIDFSRQRLKAALESIREKTLRAKYLPGDVLESLEQARYQYYRTAMDYLDALNRQLQTQADLLALAPDNCLAEKTASASRGEIPP